MENRFYPTSGSPGYKDREEWLNELQRRFSADLERESEVFNTNPHVEGCSSESDEEVSICRENNSSIYAPCSGLKSRDRTSVDDRIDDLYRIVKLHSQQMNLLQTQIQSLVDLIQNSSLGSKCQCCKSQNPSDKHSFEGPGNALEENPRFPSDVSEVLPRCTFDPNLVAGMTQNEHNFFSTVMGTLRGILSESDLETGKQTEPESSNPVYDGGIGNADKTMLNATLEQLRRLGVSFIESRSSGPKKVTFCESSAPKSESSVEIDSLARKYLASGSDGRRPEQIDGDDRKKRQANKDGRVQRAIVDERRGRRMDAAIDQIQNLQKKTTDLSLATLKYLRRYKLGAKGVDESALLPKRIDRPKEPMPTTEKILDSVAIRSQPKLSNHNQWLRK